MRGFAKLPVVLLVVLFACSQDEDDSNGDDGSNLDQEVVDATSFAADESVYTCLTSTSTPFVSVWDVAANDVVKLPLVSNKRYNFTVDWGDDSEKGQVTSHDDPDAEHTYTDSESGGYTITITGAAEAWSFSEVPESRDKITAVTDLGNLCWRDFAGAFKDCSNLGVVNRGDTSQVTDMSYMFAGATAATPDTSGWDTSQVTDMSYMFAGATAATPDTSGWDTSQVTDMSYMFAGAIKATPTTSSWDTTKVTDMQFMFFDAEAAEPETSGWVTKNVTNMNGMFKGATVATPITVTATDTMTDMEAGVWDTTNVKNMQSMFEGAAKANPDTSGWVTKNVKNMSTMFKDAIAATPDTSGWDTSQVTDMSSMFAGTTVANPDTRGWDTSQVTNMQSMFAGATAATLNTSDTSKWDTSQVTDMSSMFAGTTVANPDTSGWDTAKVTNMRAMFMGAKIESNGEVLKRDNTNLSNVDMSNWSFAGLEESLDDMFLYSTLPATNYSGLLQRLDSGGMFPAGPDKVLNAGCSLLDSGDTAGGKAAKDSLITNGWVITDGHGVGQDNDDNTPDSENNKCNVPSTQ